MRSRFESVTGVEFLLVPAGPIDVLREDGDHHIVKG